MNTSIRKVARWESTGGKYWVQLICEDGYYAFDTYYGGGTLNSELRRDEDAISTMQKEIDMSLYQSDLNKSDMRRVAVRIMELR